MVPGSDATDGLESPDSNQALSRKLCQSTITILSRVYFATFPNAVLSGLY